MDQGYPHYATRWRNGTYRFLLLGGRMTLGVAATGCAPARKRESRRKTTLRQVAAFCATAAFTSGAESAGAHIACAVGTPSVVVLGGGHFGRFLPYHR